MSLTLSRTLGRSDLVHTLRKCTRWYQTKTGVFGYLPKHTVKQNKIEQVVLDKRANNANFYRLVTAYREHGHRRANINPISLAEVREEVAELDPKQYGLEDMTGEHDWDGILYDVNKHGSLADSVEYLERTYCGSASVECAHMDVEEREWFAGKFEQFVNSEVGCEERRRLLFDMLKSETFDQFLAAKFVTLKRYGGEGTESMVGFFMKLMEECGRDVVEEIVIAMPHRGRLNLLTGCFQLPPTVVFRKIKGHREFGEEVEASCDVVSHLTCSVDLTPDPTCTRQVHVTMLPNPSHLEAVNPVSMGKTRAKQMMIGEGGYGNGFTRFGHKIVNVQVHGDAAFSGQGINQETLSLSQLPHYEVGGTIHLVVNNQLGFTTPGERGRSSRYATDLAKMISAPVIHVNADYPESVLKATSLAVKYQRKYRKDVFVELNCYRQWGHNELDDPTITSPSLYKLIRSRETIPGRYARRLVEEGVVSQEEVDRQSAGYYDQLNKDLQRVEGSELQPSYFQRHWSDIKQASTSRLTTWDTGLDLDTLKYIGERSVTYPDSFNVHTHLVKTHVTSRLNAMRSSPTLVDWSTAESLAIGSLLYQGFNVRLSGQDVGRGTFSHRHVMLVDQNNDDMYIPLNNIVPDQKGKLEVANSLLSEEAVLGFEYGMSTEHPDNLIIWEAQFGDFANGAQIIIDQFVTSGETKWMRCSGLVMLLPHGYDGAGPEHSSCRLERFLQLNDSQETVADADNVNFNLINPTTPAQYYHALRRQLVRDYRKSLVVASPKILLRHPRAVSDLRDMRPNTEFLNVIADHVTQPEHVDRVIFTSGKHFYSLEKERSERCLNNVALVRIESLSPFPTHELHQTLNTYKNCKKFVWSQEEHRNMGAWSYVSTRFENLVGVHLDYVGNSVLGAPAVGVPSVHRQTQDNIIRNSFTI